MTYPNQETKTAVANSGFFTEDSKDAAKSRERVAALGLQWFRQCQEQRQRQERQWYLNLAFYYGNQHVQFKQVASSGNFDLATPPAPYYRVRIVINQVRRTVRKEISRLTAQKPNAYVVPA